MLQLAFALLVQSALCQFAHADEALELPAVIKEGTPFEALGEDAVLPSRSGGAPLNSGSGFVDHGLQNGLPLPTRETSKPGQLSQFRGLGLSPEDIDVQSLGIPINPPQGGGFDLSQFPQYMWSGYSFQNGPGLAALDPRATSGTLVLQPWTADAISRRQTGGRATLLVTDNDLHQFSGAVSTGDEAALIGFTGGDAQGPSGSASMRWERGAWSGKFHLLGTTIEAPNTGPTYSPSPRARRQVTRLIPVVQLDRAFSSTTLLKTSFYVDGTHLRNDDPDQPYNNSNDQIRQYGTELALLQDEWKFGASARRVTYEGIGFSPPAETIASLQVSRLIETGGWLLDPGVKLSGVSRLGFSPESNFGARRELSTISGLQPAIFTRATYSRRYPSLIDRYYVLPGYGGNPDLKPETDYTLIAGSEARGPQGRGWIQATGQYRQDVQATAAFAAGATTTYRRVNQGDAWVASGEGGLVYQAWSRFELWDTLTYNEGRIIRTASKIPYLPKVINLAGGTYTYKIMRLTSIIRSASNALDPTANGESSGYTTLDVEAGFQLHERYRLTVGAQNLLNRSFEIVHGYPSAGRVFSALLTGQF